MLHLGFLIVLCEKTKLDSTISASTVFLSIKNLISFPQSPHQSIRMLSIHFWLGWLKNDAPVGDCILHFSAAIDGNTLDKIFLTKDFFFSEQLVALPALVFFSSDNINLSRNYISPQGLQFRMIG